MGRTGIVLAGVLLPFVLTGCSAHHATAPASAPRAATPSSDHDQTLVVKTYMGGPRFQASALSVTGAGRRCQEWNVTSVSYGGSVEVQHLLVTRQEGPRVLAAVRGLRGVRSASLQPASEYDHVPAPERGFPTSRAFACRPGTTS